MYVQDLCGHFLKIPDGAAPSQEVFPEPHLPLFLFYLKTLGILLVKRVPDLSPMSPKAAACSVHHTWALYVVCPLGAQPIEGSSTQMLEKGHSFERSETEERR